MKIKTIEASGSNEYQDAYSMLKRWRGLRYVAEITEFEDERQCTIELQKKVDEMILLTRQPNPYDAERINNLLSERRGNGLNQPSIRHGIKIAAN